MLLVAAVIGAGVAALNFLDPDNIKDRKNVRAGDPELLFRREIPLGDEFVCLVRVNEYSSPESTDPPYHMSCVRFARRSAGPSAAFVLEFIGDATGDWQQSAPCRAWALMSPDEALDHLYAQGELTVTPSKLTKDERMATLIDCLSPKVHVVSRLDDPLRPCVPPALAESGIVLLTGEWGVQYVHEFQGFPLGRLASAIRTAARDDDWTLHDPAALLLQNKRGDPPLTDDEQQAIAQAFVYRLLDYFAQEASASEGTCDGTPIK